MGSRPPRGRVPWYPRRRDQAKQVSGGPIGLEPKLRESTGAKLGAKEVAKAIAATGLFSNRQRELRNEMGLSGYTSAKGARVAALRTRQSKDPNLDFGKLRDVSLEESLGLSAAGKVPMVHQEQATSALANEIASVNRRITAHGQKHGFSLPLQAGRDATGGAPGTWGDGAPAWVLDEDLVTVLNGDGPIAPREARRTFGSPPSRQRVYSASEVATLAALTLDSRAEGAVLLESSFGLGGGVEARFELEDSMRNLAKDGKGLFRLESDSGLSATVTGKALAGGLGVLRDSDRVPQGARVLVSANVSPGDVASLLSGEIYRPEIYFVDQKRSSRSQDSTIGRGSSWRSWLRESCRGGTSPASENALSQGSSGALVVQRDQVTLVIHARSETMRDDLAAQSDGVTPGQITVVADAKMALGVRQFPIACPMVKSRNDLGGGYGEREYSDGLLQSGHDDGAPLDRRNVVTASTAAGIAEIKGNHAMAALLGELRDSDSLTEGVVLKRDNIEVHVVEPIASTMATQEARLVSRTLSALGFIQDLELLAMLDADSLGRTQDLRNESVSEVRIQLGELQEMNLRALRDLGHQHSTFHPPSATGKSALGGFGQINLRLGATLCAQGSIHGFDGARSDDSLVTLNRLSSVIEALEAQGGSRRSAPLNEPADDLGASWLLRVAKVSLESTRRALELDGSALAPDPLTLLGRARRGDAPVQKEALLRPRMGRNKESAALGIGS